MPHVFICYLRQNSDKVNRLVQDLECNSVSVWLDRKKIHPGTRWKDAIRTAIQNGALFLPCFSREYEARKRSYMNEELTLAIDELRLRPTDRSWFIPVVLDGGTIPNRDIGGGETLHNLQWVDLSLDWTDGVRRIVDTFRQDFFHAVDAVLAGLVKVDNNTLAVRSAYWDTWNQRVAGLSDQQRLDILKKNTRYFLDSWSLTVTQLKQQLHELGCYDGPIDGDLSDTLVEAIERFQRNYNLRHVDGVFGELTYLEMERVAAVRNRV
ncbi:MAG: TIR domain-containing protein [Gammaproteobacteria bacterium]|nr:TIR domain-containing protein [Gammaproteobacteria bacterium]